MGRSKRGRRRAKYKHPVPNEPNGGGQKNEPTSDASNTVATAKTEDQQPDTATSTNRFKSQIEPADRSEIDRLMVKWTAVVGRWTRAVAVFTALLVVATVGSIVVLYITDHTLRSGQRGFAFVKETSWLAVTRNGQVFWWALPNWENSGNTPINPVNFELSCPSIEGGAENVADPYALKRFADGTGKTSRTSTQIGPKQSKFGGDCEFAVDDVKRIQDGKKTQYVIAQARYSDVYGDVHVTRFCERLYNIRGDVSGGPNIQVAGVPCARYNCSDEECTREDAEPNLPPEKLKPPGPVSVPPSK